MVSAPNGDPAALRGQVAARLHEAATLLEEAGDSDATRLLRGVARRLGGKDGEKE